MTDDLNSKEKDIVDFYYQDYEWVDYSDYQYYPCVVSSKRTVTYQTPKFFLKHVLGFTDRKLEQGRYKKYRSFFKLGRVPDRTRWQSALIEDQSEGFYLWSPFFTCIIGTLLEDPYATNEVDLFPDDRLSPKGWGFCFIRYPSCRFLDNVYDGYLEQEFEIQYRHHPVIKFLLRWMLRNAYYSCKKE